MALSAASDVAFAVNVPCLALVGVRGGFAATRLDSLAGLPEALAHV